MKTTKAPVPVTPPQKLNKSSRVLAIREADELRGDFVPHWGLEEVRRLVAEAERERDRLMVELLFDGCLRVSEMLSIRPCDIVQDQWGWKVRIVGKGRKPAEVAISASLAAKLHAYCYQQGIGRNERIFKINRSRVFQIVKELAEKAGLKKPAGVGTVHILRHSGAIERLRRTGNPKALQDHLRHQSAKMTLRYLKTLSAEESRKIQQAVDLGW